MDYVALISGGTVRVLSEAPDLLVGRLRPELSASVGAGCVDIQYAEGSAEGLGRTLRSLRDAGVAFSAGRDWSPAAIFEDLRDRGLVDGTYDEIAWSGPGEPRVTRR